MPLTFRCACVANVTIRLGLIFLFSSRLLFMSAYVFTRLALSGVYCGGDGGGDVTADVPESVGVEC